MTTTVATPIRSQKSTCHPLGGTGAYIYSWERVSGSTAITADTPSAQATTFSATLPVPGPNAVADFRCKVSDGRNIVYTDNVTVNFVATASQTVPVQPSVPVTPPTTPVVPVVPPTPVIQPSGIAGGSSEHAPLTAGLSTAHLNNAEAFAEFGWVAGTGEDADLDASFMPSPLAIATAKIYGPDYYRPGYFSPNPTVLRDSAAQAVFSNTPHRVNVIGNCSDAVSIYKFDSLEKLRETVIIAGEVYGDSTVVGAVVGNVSLPDTRTTSTWFGAPVTVISGSTQTNDLVASAFLNVRAATDSEVAAGSGLFIITPSATPHIITAEEWNYFGSSPANLPRNQARGYITLNADGSRHFAGVARPRSALSMAGLSFGRFAKESGIPKGMRGMPVLVRSIHRTNADQIPYYRDVLPESRDTKLLDFTAHFHPKYLSWTPSAVPGDSSHPTGGVSSFELKYQTGVSGSAASIRLRLLTFVPDTPGGSAGIYHYAIHNAGGAGTISNPFSYGNLCTAENMPQTFVHGSVILGPFGVPDNFVPPDSTDLEAYEAFCNDHMGRWLEEFNSPPLIGWDFSYYSPGVRVLDGPTISMAGVMFRSKRINNATELADIRAMNGSWITTPYVVHKTWRIVHSIPFEPQISSAQMNTNMNMSGLTPITPDKYWDSRNNGVEHNRGTCFGPNYGSYGMALPGLTITTGPGSEAALQDGGMLYNGVSVMGGTDGEAGRYKKIEGSNMIVYLGNPAI